MAVRADAVGEFWTFPIPAAGRRLRLNLRTRAAGEVRVGIHGVTGRSADDCDPICGDHLAATVHWKGDPSVQVARGQQVTLHFRLRAAQLFGFEWV